MKEQRVELRFSEVTGSSCYTESSVAYVSRRERREDRVYQESLATPRTNRGERPESSDLRDVHGAGKGGAQGGADQALPKRPSEGPGEGDLAELDDEDHRKLAEKLRLTQAESFQKHFGVALTRLRGTRDSVASEADLMKRTKRPVAVDVQVKRREQTPGIPDSELSRPSVFSRVQQARLFAVRKRNNLRR